MSLSERNELSLPHNRIPREFAPRQGLLILKARKLPQVCQGQCQDKLSTLREFSIFPIHNRRNICPPSLSVIGLQDKGMG